MMSLRARPTLGELWSKGDTGCDTYGALMKSARTCGKPGLVERVVEASSEDEIKPIDWLVPVS